MGLGFWFGILDLGFRICILVLVKVWRYFFLEPGAFCNRGQFVNGPVVIGCFVTEPALQHKLRKLQITHLAVPLLLLLLLLSLYSLGKVAWNRAYTGILHSCDWSKIGQSCIHLSSPCSSSSHPRRQRGDLRNTAALDIRIDVIGLGQYYILSFYPKS